MNANTRQSDTYADTRGLGRSDFLQVAANGWGDRLNAYAYSMAWFDEALYVGNSRGNLVMIHRNHPDWMKTWPVRMPREFHDLDFRSQIWRYTPRSGQWRQVYCSPRVAGREGKQVPRDIGYRSMAVHDRALYVASFSPASSGMPPQILRSRDGKIFEAVAKAGTDPALNTYRTLQVFDGYLYTSPTGRAGGAANACESAAVLRTRDPASQPWQTVSSLGFGDSSNQTFFEMAVFNEYLYVGTLNPVTGFQIWKTRGGRDCRWSSVIKDGASRGNLNEIAISMCVFNGALYVGTAIQNGGYDRVNKVGPAPAELIRIHPDDSWDLIVGNRRVTPTGVKVPLSGRTAGFDNPFNAYFWRMAVHDGWLYVGTYKWTVFLPYLTQQRWGRELRWMVNQIGAEELACLAGGFDLWRSPDGVNWFPVTRNGFDNPYNHGVRTLQSTPYGLFVGTANPFGPDIAVRSIQSSAASGGWQFRPNNQGGLEIWLGSARNKER
jgi:hypothetical protein